MKCRFTRMGPGCPVMVCWSSSSAWVSMGTCLTNASRVGSRRAVIEGVSKSEVQQLVKDYLEGASISGATISVSPSDFNTLGLGDPVNVSLSVPYKKVAWFPSWFLGDRTLTASTTMRAERLQ